VDNELEVIRHQMEEKRASLADKLDALENEVVQTVQLATAEVSHIVQDVKSTVDSVTEGVQETVESVKDSLDIREAVRCHPWAALGGAFAVGLAGAWVLGPSSRQPAPRWDYRPETYGPPPEPTRPTTTQTPGEPSPLAEAASTALTGLKGLAIGVLMGVVREVVTNALPEAIKDETSRLLDQVTTQLGGKTFADLGVMQSEKQTTTGDSNGNGNQTEMGRPLGSAPREDQEPVGQPDRRRADRDRRGLRTNDWRRQGANGKNP